MVTNALYTYRHNGACEWKVMPAFTFACVQLAVWLVSSDQQRSLGTNPPGRRTCLWLLSRSPLPNLGWRTIRLLPPPSPPGAPRRGGHPQQPRYIPHMQKTMQLQIEGASMDQNVFVERFSVPSMYTLLYMFCLNIV